MDSKLENKFKRFFGEKYFYFCLNLHKHKHFVLDDNFMKTLLKEKLHSKDFIKWRIDKLKIK